MNQLEQPLQAHAPRGMYSPGPQLLLQGRSGERGGSRTQHTIWAAAFHPGACPAVPDACSAPSKTDSGANVQCPKAERCPWFGHCHLKGHSPWRSQMASSAPLCGPGTKLSSRDTQPCCCQPWEPSRVRVGSCIVKWATSSHQKARVQPTPRKSCDRAGNKCIWGSLCWLSGALGPWFLCSPLRWRCVSVNGR